MAGTESSVSFPALGSIAVVATTEPEHLARAREQVERAVAEFDRACSRFRDDSELSRVNRADGTAVRVGPVLLAAVLEALRAARLTDGDVDPTVGQALMALGYDRDFRHMAGRSRPISVVPVPGWRVIEVDPDAATVRVPRGVRLDLGATAKALAADRAAAAAYAACGCGVLVGLGGDIAITGPASPQGWRVRVTDDHRAGLEAPGQWITLRAGGLATSSTTVRRWQAGAREAHHLVDPASGRPVAARWRTVSVCAGSCLDANIASTAAIVRGTRAPAWLLSSALPSRLVGVDGRVSHLAGWPSKGDDLTPGPSPALAGTAGS